MGHKTIGLRAMFGRVLSGVCTLGISEYYYYDQDEKRATRARNNRINQNTLLRLKLKELELKAKELELLEKQIEGKL